jgi:hypothetical protein
MCECDANANCQQLICANAMRMRIPIRTTSPDKISTHHIKCGVSKFLRACKMFWIYMPFSERWFFWTEVQFYLTCTPDLGTPFGQVIFFRSWLQIFFMRHHSPPRRFEWIPGRLRQPVGVGPLEPHLPAEGPGHLRQGDPRSFQPARKQVWRLRLWRERELVAAGAQLCRHSSFLREFTWKNELHLLLWNVFRLIFFFLALIIYIRFTRRSFLLNSNSVLRVKLRSTKLSSVSWIRLCFTKLNFVSRDWT